MGGFPGASRPFQGAPGGQAGLGHPPWREGGGVARLEACLQGGIEGVRDLNTLRLDASANFFLIRYQCF